MHVCGFEKRRREKKKNLLHVDREKENKYFPCVSCHERKTYGFHLVQKERQEMNKKIMKEREK